MVVEKHTIDSPVVDFSREQQRQWYYTHVKEHMSFMERTYTYKPFTNYSEAEIKNKIETI